MPARRFAARTALLLAVAAATAGCSTIDSAVGGLFGGEATRCPAVGVLQGAGHLMRFREDGGRALEDIEFESQVASLTAECRFDGETQIGSVDLDIEFRAQRGPAGAGEGDEFSYFVAVVDPDGEPVTRETFSVQVSFAGGDALVMTAESLAVAIPTTEGAPFAAHRVYVGMQLTREQLDFNMGVSG